MKKLLLFALGALLATGVSAQGLKKGQKEVFLLKNGDKVVVIKDMRQGPGKEFRRGGRQADFRRDQFRKDFRKKDFRRGPNRDCKKCRKAHKRHMRR